MRALAALALLTLAGCLDDFPAAPALVPDADAPLAAKIGPGGGIAGLSVQSHLHKLVAEGRVVQDGKRYLRA